MGQLQRVSIPPQMISRTPSLLPGGVLTGRAVPTAPIMVERQQQPVPIYVQPQETPGMQLARFLVTLPNNYVMAVDREERLDQSVIEALGCIVDRLSGTIQEEIHICICSRNHRHRS